MNIIFQQFDKQPGFYWQSEETVHEVMSDGAERTITRKSELSWWNERKKAKGNWIENTKVIICKAGVSWILNEMKIKVNDIVNFLSNNQVS